MRIRTGIENDNEYSQATDLGHDSQESNRADVSALAAHVTASNDLESTLLSGIHVVGDECSLHNLLSNWMSSILQTESVSNARFDCLGINFTGYVIIRQNATVP